MRNSTSYFKKSAALLALLIAISPMLVQGQDKTVYLYNGESEISTSNGSITLLPGFTVPAGSSLRVYIKAIPSFSSFTTLNATPTAGRNYISSKVFKTPGVFTESDVNLARSNEHVSQTVQYIDGLGRLEQTVMVQGSPGFNDVVQPAAYDDLGREKVKYLPYVTGGVNGAFRTDAIPAQMAFYNAPAPAVGVPQIPNAAFSETRLEASPSGRALEQSAPGVPWQLASGHTVKMEYGTNSAIETRWVVSANGATAASYGINTLNRTLTKDENWIAENGKAGTTEEFKDTEGRVVLKRIWETDSKSLSTFYVYDDMGDLRYVLPPAVNLNGQSPTSGFIETDAVFKQFIYGYHYDGRRRLVEKQVPGKGWERIVYNKLDQVVLTQDANLNSDNQWMYTKYDGLGRVTSTGIYLNTGLRADLQATVNGQTVLKESRATDEDYTNLAFPQGDTEVLSINYYDDYSFPEGTSYTYGPHSNKTRGLLTGSKIKVLGSSSSGMLLSLNFYDQEGKVVKSFKQHYLSGAQNAANYDEVSSTYNFGGELIKSIRIHHVGADSTKIENRYDYDHMGRKLATTEFINKEPEVALNRMIYNELGQLVNKSVHSTDGTSFLQNSSYSYNERGWSKGMISDQFSYGLSYQDGNVPQFNGNISNQDWGAGSSLPNRFTYDYDKLNRLISGVAPGMSERLTYDVMGNIKSMNRDGVIGTYNYTGNRLDNISAGGLATGDYIYDLHGNATTDGRTATTLSYNVLDLPATAKRSGLDMSYVYSADGSKLRKQGGFDGTRNYIDGIEYDGTGIEIIRTEEGVARRNGTSFVYEYNLTDHLGNVRYSFNKHPVTGVLQQLQTSNYYAFGKRSAGSAGQNKYLYNGKELQDELGQYDYGARFYDPVIGRFNTIDPLAEKDRRWSSYSYGHNNPITHIDVDGMFDWVANSNNKPRWDDAVTRADDKDLKPGDHYIGKSAEYTTSQGYTVELNSDKSWNYKTPEKTAQPEGPTIGEAVGANMAILNVAEGIAVGTAVAAAGEVGGAEAAGNFLLGQAARKSTFLAGMTEGANIGANLVTSGINLAKQLASESQMSEQGLAIIGSGKLRDAGRLAKEYGGNALDWIKKSSSSFSKGGTTFETHWYENVVNGLRTEFKTKFP